ncbi:MAG: hypothetical protein KatS3mg124_1751 [Porticoccaceae bacterium]|nr:MAG: hypothetical protein KatS3mg124_1751 [Porticoccaceae bacterium]
MRGKSWRIAIALFVVLLAPGCGERPEATAEPSPVGGPALIRRLTESQYRHTLADLFGPEAPVVARFERELRAHGLIAAGTSEAGISAFAMEQYDAAARALADYLLAPERRAAYLPCTPRAEVAFDADCAARFVARWGERLFRRPLTEAQVARYVDAARTAAATLGDFHEGLEYALVGLLIAPQFLLRIEHVEPDPARPGGYRLDPWSRAERLAFFLTDSTPDEALLAAAASGELDTPEGLARQVDRLMGLARFEDAVRAFFRDMLEFDRFADLAKDAQIYPAWTPEVALDAQEQTLRDLVWHLVREGGDYRDLFVLGETHMTRALGVLYRQPVPPRQGFARIPLSHDGSRLGIQSHLSFLALHAHPGRSSPTLRGKAIREIFLCQEVPDPPPNVNFSLVQEGPGARPTARERLAAHNTEPACAGCHKVMDPVGLALENYDGAGIFRREENGAPIDASGFLDGTAYEDAAGLARALRDHPETPRCLVEKLYRFAVGRDTVWGERAYLDWLVEAFARAGYRVPELMRTIALSEQFFAIAPPAERRWAARTVTLEEDRP